MIEISLDWLNNPVPLWAFLLALLSAPYVWSQYVKRGVGDLYGRYFGQD